MKKQIVELILFKCMSGDKRQCFRKMTSYFEEHNCEPLNDNPNTPGENKLFRGSWKNLLSSWTPPPPFRINRVILHMQCLLELMEIENIWPNLAAALGFLEFLNRSGPYIIN